MKTVNYNEKKQKEKINFLSVCSCNNWSTRPTMMKMIEKRKEEIFKNN